MAYRVRNLSKSYGQLKVLDGLSLDFAVNSVNIVLGPSGCGKTTLLNILAGLDTAFEGSLEEFSESRKSYAFQEDRLIPWLTALDNVAFPLKEYNEDKKARQIAAQALEAVGLSESTDILPARLSGGMRKRVALARAFAFPSDVILMDEPFSSLDLRNRIAIMDLFLGLRKSSGRTAVLVTHDVREAIYLGDRLFTLSEKPSRVLDSVELELGEEQRGYGSSDAAEIEARLYRTILGSAT